MKSIKIIACLFSAMILFTSCNKETIRVSGEVIRTEVNFTSYSGLKVSDAFNVFVLFSDSEERIIIEANEDIQDRIEVKKEGEDLIVRLEKSTSITGNATLNVYITTKQLSAFNITGASHVTLDNMLTSENILLEISGASTFTGELIAENMEVEASGASNIDVFGNATVLEAMLEGASNLSDYDLVTEELDIDLSGASNAFLSVTERIDIRASGASVLNYKGDAAIGIQELSGSSEIIQKD